MSNNQSIGVNNLIRYIVDFSANLSYSNRIRQLEEMYSGVNGNLQGRFNINTLLGIVDSTEISVDSDLSQIVINGLSAGIDAL